MALRIIIGCLVILCFAFTGTNRELFIKDYFISPVEGTMLLSGTFGELRSDHFHAGIDIKGGMNVPIKAAAEGYISRINVSGRGYGNVLYITHPKGYTTVYAHLNAFTPEIADYVEKFQLEKKAFSINIEPSSELFPVEKGEQIGWMGSTGSSSGPHLHFEIRDDATQQALNPLRFGFKYNQDGNLRIHQLKVYELDDNLRPKHMQEFDPDYASGQYAIQKDTILVRSDRIGVAVKAYDHMNKGRNWNGIYGVDMMIRNESVPYYQFRMDAIPFGTSRYINAHLDYTEYLKEKSYYNRCFLLPGNEGRIYPQLTNDGVIELQVGEKVPVRIRVLSANGAEKQLVFWIKRISQPRELPATEYTYWLEHDQENIISNFELFAHFREGTFYRDVPMQYAKLSESSYQVFSPVHILHEIETPIHHFFTLGLRPSLMPDSLYQKAFIGRCTAGNRIINYGGEWKDGMLVTRTRSFGDYAVMVDTQKPTITPKRFRKNMKGWTKMWFTINDNFSTAGSAKSLSFNAEIDGQWALMVYDAKKDRLTHKFRSDLTAGEHTLRITLKDAMGNESVFEETFTR